MEQGSCGGVIHLDNFDKNEIESNQKIINDLKKELNKVSDNEINYFVFFYNRSKKVNAYKTIISETIGKSIKDKFKDSIESLEPEHLYNYNDSDGLNNDNPELINSYLYSYPNPHNSFLNILSISTNMLKPFNLPVDSSDAIY